jgi:hypothetical protein
VLPVILWPLLRTRYQLGVVEKGSVAAGRAKGLSVETDSHFAALAYGDVRRSQQHHATILVDFRLLVPTSAIAIAPPLRIDARGHPDRALVSVGAGQRLKTHHSGWRHTDRLVDVDLELSESSRVYL